MSNEFTKKQIKDFLEQAVKKAQNPDPREQAKGQRAKRKQKVATRYGF